MNIIKLIRFRKEVNDLIDNYLLDHLSNDGNSQNDREEVLGALMTAFSKIRYIYSNRKDDNCNSDASSNSDIDVVSDEEPIIKSLMSCDFDSKMETIIDEPDYESALNSDIWYSRNYNTRADKRDQFVKEQNIPDKSLYGVSFFDTLNSNSNNADAIISELDDSDDSLSGSIDLLSDISSEIIEEDDNESIIANIKNVKSIRKDVVHRYEHELGDSYLINSMVKDFKKFPSRIVVLSTEDKTDDCKYNMFINDSLVSHDNIEKLSTDSV